MNTQAQQDVSRTIETPADVIAGPAESEKRVRNLSGEFDVQLADGQKQTGPFGTLITVNYRGVPQSVAGGFILKSSAEEQVIGRTLAAFDRIMRDGDLSASGRGRAVAETRVAATKELRELESSFAQVVEQARKVHSLASSSKQVDPNAVRSDPNAMHAKNLRRHEIRNALRSITDVEARRNALLDAIESDDVEALAAVASDPAARIAPIIDPEFFERVQFLAQQRKQPENARALNAVEAIESDASFNTLRAIQKIGGVPPTHDRLKMTDGRVIELGSDNTAA